MLITPPAKPSILPAQLSTLAVQQPPLPTQVPTERWRSNAQQQAVADLVTSGGAPTLFGRASGQGRPVVPLRARQYHSKTSLAQSVTQVHLRQRQHTSTNVRLLGVEGRPGANKNHGTACRPEAHLGSLLPHATPAMQLTEVLTQAKKWGYVAHHWRGHLWPHESPSECGAPETRGGCGSL